MNVFFLFEAIYCKIKSLILLPIDCANMMGLFAITMKYTQFVDSLTCSALSLACIVETLLYAPIKSGPTKSSKLEICECFLKYLFLELASHAHSKDQIRNFASECFPKHMKEDEDSREWDGRSP